MLQSPLQRLWSLAAGLGRCGGVHSEHIRAECDLHKQSQDETHDEWTVGASVVKTTSPPTLQLPLYAAGGCGFPGERDADLGAAAS